jgi:2-amino-4-hydroxy-6-hydroxymethyldihydropteridine diphosphokinase
MPMAYLGLGSNVGNKEEHIKKALTSLSNICYVRRTSHLYLTEPVDYTEQDWFLNCVVEIETDVESKKLLSCIKSIERNLGRTTTVKKGPRIIDIDILFYGDQVIKTKDLVIPHPLLQERLFVLRPMMDINPDFIHPVLKKSIREFYKDHHWAEKVTIYK